MELIASKLREERGEVALLGGVILLVSIIFLTVALQVNHTYATIDMVKERTNAAVLAVAASNVTKIHDGVREGDWIARAFDGTAWNHIVSTDAVIHSLAISLHAAQSGTVLTRDNGVQLTNIHTSAANHDGEKLNFTTTLTIYIPLSFAGGTLPPIQHDLVVYTTYEAKF